MARERNDGVMAHILVTGSTDGLGRATADTLISDGHTVVVHARNPSRAQQLDALIDRGAELLIADFANRDQVLEAAEHLNDGTPLDGIIHNAGVVSGQALMPVNVVAPYLLTALVRGPRRHVYLSSGMHRSGKATLDRIDWNGDHASASYSDSKLFVTALSAAVARRRADLFSNAVDPGWVATKMGGAGAPDDFDLGHQTQELLVVGTAPTTDVSGGYWHHAQQQRPHPAVLDQQFQEELVLALERATGVVLPAF